MGYYMRFFDTEKKSLTLRNLRAMFRRLDRGYDINIPKSRQPQSGILTYGGVVYAEIDLSARGDGLFEEEIEEMLACVASVRGKKLTAAKNRVEAVLAEAKRTVVVCVRFGTKDVEETLSRIDPLWDWLFDERAGLLHAQGEGFYDEDLDLVLALK